MFATLSNTAVTDFIKTTGDYQKAYETARGTYLAAAKALKEQTGPYKASRDAYVAATATYSLCTSKCHGFVIGAFVGLLRPSCI